METKKQRIISVVATIGIILMLVGATYAYFQAQVGEGKSTDVNISASTIDVFTFVTGDPISININQDNFASGKGNQVGFSYAKATLLANNKTNEATEHYYLYFYIPNNSFVYTRDDNTAELLLQVTDLNGEKLSEIDGLEYKTVTDGLGNEVSGFDITTKIGMYTIINNQEINASPESEHIWNISVVFVNLDSNQNENTGKTFKSQLIITKDDYEDYTPAMVNTINTTVDNSNLTISVNADGGTEGIDKYYYAIKENDNLALNSSNVTKLSNKLALNELEYIESSSNTYTFTGINSDSNYEVFVYVVDNKKITSNIYKSKLNNKVDIPIIKNVEVTNKTSTSMEVSVTTNKNNINKYYYSIGNGEFVESSSSTYTFNNLLKNTRYKIKVKVSDINNNYSYVYELNESITSVSLANWVVNKYNGVQGNNNIYYHNSSLENGAGDNSYRYSGSSSSVNNYVCFGSDDDTCSDDNLYRIIGVFDDRVRLIKADYATNEMLGTDTDDVVQLEQGTWNPSSHEYAGAVYQPQYYWNNANYSSSNTLNNDWSISELNKTHLNINFISYLNNINSKWVNMIDVTTWKVGGNTNEDIYGTNAKTAYLEEITNSSTEVINTYESKIGLMYVSDYYYGASNTYWTYPGYNSSDSSSDYRAAQESNWMHSGLNEWTMTRSTSNSNCAYAVSDYIFGFLVNLDKNEGSIDIIGNNDSVSKTTGLYVRPVFQLLSSVSYVSGTGAKNDPIYIN